MEIEGRPSADGPRGGLSFPTRSVTPDYFSALGLKLTEGRSFRPSDDDQAPVAIINQAAVDRHFPGENALGRKLKFRGQTNFIEIVGILANTRTDALTDAAEPELYPFWQSSAFSSTSWYGRRATQAWWRQPCSVNCARLIPPSRWKTSGLWSGFAPTRSHRGPSR